MALLLLQSGCWHDLIAMNYHFLSWSHHFHGPIAVTVWLLTWSHCHEFPFSVMIPSLSWPCCCYSLVVGMILLPWISIFCHDPIIVMLLQSGCWHDLIAMNYHFLSWSHHCHAVTVWLLAWSHCHELPFSVMIPSLSCCYSLVVGMLAVRPSISIFCHDPIIVMLLLSGCWHVGSKAINFHFLSWSHHCHAVTVTNQLLSWSHCLMDMLMMAFKL
jgi:hypothetical protein